MNLTRSANKGFAPILLASVALTLTSLTLGGCATTQPPAQVRLPQTPNAPNIPTAPNAPNAPAQTRPVDIPVTPLEPSQPAQNSPANSPQSGTPKEIEPVTSAQIDYGPRDGLTPPHMDGRNIRRIALILPFSASNSRLREEASAMLQAAEMAVFDRAQADTLLIALDSAGTRQGASTAAQDAIRSGADVILGPLLSANSAEAAREARKSGTPIISFSSDQSIAGNGLFLLSFPPEAEVARVTEYAAEQGALNFAFLGPQSTYGNRVHAAYEQAVTNIGGQVSVSESYSGNTITAMQEPARRIAQNYSTAHAAGRPPIFDAIILPEGGTTLRSLAPLLTYYEGRTANAQLLGTGLWNQDEVSQEPALKGGIFAGPDLDGKAQFETNYQASFNAPASRLSSLAYDGLNIAANIANGTPQQRAQNLTDPLGFYGVDGFVRFGPDGLPQRGLAIYEVSSGRFIQIDPAPKTAEEMDIQN